MRQATRARRWLCRSLCHCGLAAVQAGSCRCTHPKNWLAARLPRPRLRPPAALGTLRTPLAACIHLYKGLSTGRSPRGATAVRTFSNIAAGQVGSRVRDTCAVIGRKTGRLRFGCLTSIVVKRAARPQSARSRRGAAAGDSSGARFFVFVSASRFWERARRRGLRAGRGWNAHACGARCAWRMSGVRGRLPTCRIKRMRAGASFAWQSEGGALALQQPGASHCKAVKDGQTLWSKPVKSAWVRVLLLALMECQGVEGSVHAASRAAWSLAHARAQCAGCNQVKSSALVGQTQGQTGVNQCSRSASPVNAASQRSESTRSVRVSASSAKGGTSKGGFPRCCAFAGLAARENCAFQESFGGDRAGLLSGTDRCDAKAYAARNTNAQGGTHEPLSQPPNRKLASWAIQPVQKCEHAGASPTHRRRRSSSA